jgi:hypothetical protein
MVTHTQRHYRTQFRKLAFGQAFWLASNPGVGPFIKRGRTAYLGGWNATPDGSPILTTVSDTSVAVVRVPEVFLAQNRTLS